MAGFRLVFLLCIIYNTAEEGLRIDKILGDPAEFSPTENCKERGGKLVHRLTDDSTRLVAHWDGVWKPGPAYEDRMSPKDSVILDSTNNNDSGPHELTCGGEDETRIHLNVVRATKVSVNEEQSVRYPLHYITLGQQGKYRLEKDGELVFELALSSRVMRYRAGFKGRLFVKFDWRLQGDLMLIFKRVNLADQGDYFSYVKRENGREHLSALRMMVNKRNPVPITHTPPPVFGSRPSF